MQLIFQTWKVELCRFKHVKKSKRKLSLIVYNYDPLNIKLCYFVVSYRFLVKQGDIIIYIHIFSKQVVVSVLEVANNIIHAPVEELQAAQEMNDVTNRVVQILEQQLNDVELNEDEMAVRVVLPNIAAEVSNCCVMYKF